MRTATSLVAVFNAAETTLLSALIFSIGVSEKSVLAQWWSYIPALVFYPPILVGINS
jgi:hypothetical protein